MECNICVYRDTNYNNNCSLLKERNVDWDCTTIDENYIRILKEQIKYYTEKYEKTTSNKDQTIYKQQIKICEKELKKTIKRSLK